MKFNVDLQKSKTDDWRTPSFVYEAFMNKGYIDPCPYQSTINGLDIDYEDEKLFINPPYSDISTWVDYAIRQYKHGCKVFLLIPSRTDTKYFHRLLRLGCSIYFIKGRLHFNDSKKCAPFPSCFIELDDRVSWLIKGQYYSCDLNVFIKII